MPVGLLLLFVPVLSVAAPTSLETAASLFSLASQADGEASHAWSSRSMDLARAQESVEVEWRDGLAESLYDPGQISNTELLSTKRLLIASRESRRVQAVWTNAPEADWPAAGNFIVQSVRCPEQERLYLIDAWLYAPGRDKFEYLLQLETVLDSFRCAATSGA